MTPPAVCLALLLDVSSSVDAPAFDLMRRGHAEAFHAPAITRAIEADGVAVSVIQFSDFAHTVQPWRVLSSAGHAADFAALINRMERVAFGGTNTGLAVASAIRDMRAAPACEQFVVDVVTDGPPNDPADLADAHALATEAGIRINALIVETSAAEPDDAARWARESLTTPDGFALVAHGWERFASAFARKLTMEVSAR